MTLLNTPDINADINKRRGVAQRGINQGTVDTATNPQGQNVAPLLTRAQNIDSGGPSAYLVEEAVEEYQATEEVSEESVEEVPDLDTETEPEEETE